MAQIAPTNLYRAGVGSVTTAAFGFIWQNGTFTPKPGGGVISGVNSRDADNTPTNVLRCGLIMAKNSSANRYAPWAIGSIAGALASTDTTLTLTTGAAAELVRRIGTSGTFVLTSPTTASGAIQQQTVTYSAVNLSTGVVTITATGVTEVQTVTVDTIMSAGSIVIKAFDSSGVSHEVKVAYNTSWTQTVADIQTALIAKLGTAAVACAVVSTSGMSVTFSGAGYANLPQTLIAVNIASATGPTKVDVTRTTAGFDGRAVTGAVVSQANYSVPLTVVGDTAGIWVPTDGSDRDWANIPASGIIYTPNLIPYPSNAVILNYIKASMETAGVYSWTDTL